MQAFNPRPEYTPAPGGAVHQARLTVIRQRLRHHRRLNYEGLAQVLPWRAEELETAVDALVAAGEARVEADHLGFLWISDALTDPVEGEAPRAPRVT